MFATKIMRASVAEARHPSIKFLGKRTIPSMTSKSNYSHVLICKAQLTNDPASVDHTPRAHPASPTHELPADFTSSQKSSSASFSSYRQKAQQHGPLGRSAASDGTLGSLSGHSLGPVTPAKGEYFDRNELPARFRRAPIDLAEIDAIETGGATLVC